jgi:hypothetical protein
MEFFEAYSYVVERENLFTLNHFLHLEERRAQHAHRGSR